MTEETKIDDRYPVGEKRPETVTTRGGRRLADLSFDALVSGEFDQSELAITPEALRLQAEIAARAGRHSLARNFERAAELSTVPTDRLLEIYEALRPGRAGGKQALLDLADRLRAEYRADLVADLVCEAAEVYEKRGLFRFRY